MAQHEILSPLPGTFYRRPAPGTPEFVQVGAAVKEGDVLGLVEVMKQFSELPAEVSGTLVKFLVEDGDAVEAGQLLAVIESA